MSDINLFELGCKSVRRTFEAMQDLSALQDEFFDSFPIQILSTGKSSHFGQKQQNRIIDQVNNSLHQNDLDEAAHQLRREVYFDTLMPDKVSKPQDNGAQAGLKAISEHKSAGDVIQAYDEAFYKTQLQDIAAEQHDLDKTAQEIKKNISGK